MGTSHKLSMASASSLILLLGAEFTKAYAENRGSRTEAPFPAAA